MTAVQTAARQANVVSMSWGGSEFSGETQYDSAAYFGNPHVTFVAATGDDGGASGAEWPAVSPDVVSVGGTSLTLTSAWTIANQTAWNASGSFWSGFSGSAGGTSIYESEPSYQLNTVGNTGTRATPDVSSVADPNTGLSVYDTVSGSGQTGWFQVGGTSAGAPIWAGIFAAADQARAKAGAATLSSTQALNLLYGLYKSGSYYSDFYDVVNGYNYAGSAGWGYDLVTGLGTPYASKIVTAAATSNLSSTALKATTTSKVAGPTATASVSQHTTTATTAPTTTNSQPFTVAMVAATNLAPANVAITQTASTLSAPAAPTPPITSSTAPQSSAPTLPAQSSSSLTLPASALPAFDRADPASITEPVTPSADPPAPDSEPEAEPSWLLLRAWDFALDDSMSEVGDHGSGHALRALDAAAQALPLDVVPDRVLMIGGAVTLWSAWMYASRQSDGRDRELREFRLEGLGH
jgi:subtilase family serine protease